MRLIAVFCVVVLCGLSWAQEGQEAQVADTNLPPASALYGSPDAEINYIWPDAPDGSMYAGKPCEIVIGFRNKGRHSFYVTGANAQLFYPGDASFTIENYTIAEFQNIVQPGEHYAFSYRFLPHSLLESRSFGLAAFLYYHDKAGGNFTSVVFNSTIDFLEPPSSFELEGVFFYTGVGGLGLLAFFLYTRVSGAPKTQNSKVETGTSSNVVTDSWLAGTAAEKQLQKKAKNSAKTTPSKKK